MVRALWNRAGSWAPLALRIGLGVIFLFHGSQKVFGLFGGGGVEGTAAAFEKIGLTPATPMALFIGLSELLAGAAVLVGLFTRPAALLLAAVMVGAIATVHGKNGFALMKGGFEYNFALISMSLSLVLSGGGKAGLDGILFRRKEAP